MYNNLTSEVRGRVEESLVAALLRRAAVGEFSVAIPGSTSKLSEISLWIEVFGFCTENVRFCIENVGFCRKHELALSETSLESAAWREVACD